MSDLPRASLHAPPAVPVARPRRRLRLAALWLPGFLIAVLLRALFYVLDLPPDDPWLVGDWLIHYADGFVRRGLTGEVVLGIASLTALSPSDAVGVIQMLGLTALAGGLLRLAQPLPMRLPLVLMLLSPALLGLYFHNPHGGFRREVLLLGLLAPFCARIAFDRRPVGSRERGLLALALMLLSLSHEMLLAWMPLFVIALRLSPVAPRTPVWRDLLILAPAALSTLVIVLFHRGDAATALAICAALGTAAPSDCGAGDPTLGAISFLAVDTRAAFDYMLFRTPPPIAASYLAGALLSALPFAVLLRMTTLGTFLRSRGPAALALLLAAVLAQVVLLNLIAVDHGRFIHITVAGLSLVLLLAMNAQGAALQFRDLRRPRLAALLAVLFVLGWKLKHAEMWPVKLFWWSGPLLGSA